MEASFAAQGTQATLLCCLCGVPIQSNPSNMCVSCISSQVDVSDGIQRHVTVQYCKTCNRYLQPPKHWVRADLESRELLVYCTKRVKGLSKAKLVDASFIWTEPHSKRIKLRLTVQKEFNGAIVEGSFVVEFVVEWHMCPQCNKTNTNPDVWVACVQVRQHVPHKRTFFFLEQLILKHNADEDCVRIKGNHEGLDLYFGNRAHATRFVDFLQSVVPIRHRNDKQLQTHDHKSNIAVYKYTFSVEIVPLCKDDLICLPQKAASSYGGLGPLVLCTRITNKMQLLDFSTLRSTYIDAPSYWRYSYKSLLTSRDLVTFVILDIDTAGAPQGKWLPAEATVARESDFGVNDKTFFTRTHLGRILKPGDLVLGYDLANANTNDQDYDTYIHKNARFPDVVLVKKSHREKRRKRGVQRNWKLKSLNRDDEMSDYEEKDQFMQELEEDADMRSRIAIYKDPSHSSRRPPPRDESAMDEDDSDDGELEIPLEELLDDLEKMEG